MLCEEGYPCVYMERLSANQLKCMCVTCPIERRGKMVYDHLTGRVTEPVLVKQPEPKLDWEVVKEQRRRRRELRAKTDGRAPKSAKSAQE